MFQAFDCPACQFTSCLCMKATPSTYSTLSTPTRQDTGTGYGEGEQRKNTAPDVQAISRLPTYSQTVLTNKNTNLYPAIQAGPEQSYQAYSPSTGGQARTVQAVWRQCWANPYQAELPGCGVQRYRGEWYNVCR